MKKLYFFFALCLVMVSNAQIINFPDANFKAKLLEADVTNEIAQTNYPLQDNIKIDANNNGEIEVAEALIVERLNVDGASITSLAGIENFANLLFLGCSNNQLTTLDLTFRPYMESIDCSNNLLTEVNFPPIEDEGVVISNNLIETLTLEGHLGFTFFMFDCRNNPNLQSLYIKNAFIETIYSAPYFSPIYLSNCPNLNYICANESDIPNIQIALTANGNVNCVVNSTCDVAPDYINFTDANFKSRLIEADINNSIAKNLAGSFFKIDANNDGQIQFTEATQVSYLFIHQGSSVIASLQGIEYFTALVELDCRANSLTQLDVSSLTLLQSLLCDINQITTLNVTGLSHLKYLQCGYNQIANLDLTELTDLIYFDCSNNQLSSLLLADLTNLETLYCRANNLASLDLSGLNNLIRLNCSSNQIATLNFEDTPNLSDLYCADNLLTSIDVSGLTQLVALGIEVNQISSIDLSSVTLLQFFSFADNLISSIDLSSFAENLQILDCSNNQLTTLDLSNMNQLSFFQCVLNPVTSLDLSGMPFLQEFNIEYNLQLTNLNLKNGVNENMNTIAFGANPNLQYICVDEDQTQDIITKVNEYGYTNCQVNSYCSFTPGGEFYTISGNQRLDSNANGCDANDLIFPNLKLSITDGTITGTSISDDSGNYLIPVQSGSHTITPIFENSNYYSVSPSSVTVNFPTEVSPFIQNFCIATNGAHNDLEVLVLPIEAARPGFDAAYKIIYKNKGTTVQSGTVQLNFNDSIMDFVSANPIVSNQTESILTWQFTNLQPLESREITFVMNLNDPMDTPALNANDTINYSVIVSGLTDESPTDNEALLNQEVVNSFDPNDKTCLEGDTIALNKVGEYVHYQIRFENTGTANAQNIVVKDMIDTAKFDIATLVPIDGSHSFITRITNTNQVEFIFENIQLPFDDDNNDGYVAFKIKTKSTLTTGSSFSNTASIYFDYNFPIITNTATTTIQALANQDFEFSNYFELAPNPAKDVLNIQTKNDIQLSSISIYNALCQLVIVIPNAKETSSIDVSQLTAGTYFIKVNSNKGSSNTKFIKE